MAGYIYRTKPIALKPCPFCGAELLQTCYEKTLYLHPRNGCVLTRCINEDGEVEISAIYDADSWNRRA